MRTPLDAFHQALVNLVDERRRTEEGTVRRRRRIGLTEGVAAPGVRVQLRMPQNLLADRGWADLAKFDRSHGTIEAVRNYGSSIPTIDVLLDADSTPGSWAIPLTFLDMADPPPTSNNIEEIEAWLAS